MRHRNAGRKLSVDTQHRIALRRNLARALFLKGRITTTPAKAKFVRPYVEKLVTRARRAGTLRDGNRAGFIHQVRLLQREVPDREVLKLLVEKIGPLFKDRPGGYVRIVHESRRQVGSAAPLAILEFVDRPAPAEGAAPEGEAEAGKGKKGKAAKADKKADKKGEKKAEKAEKKGGKKAAAAS
jgi:large subunit ribosomal protein L17